MLNIRDPNLLKITKVKPWAIYFTYDNDRYLLHGSSQDYESLVYLYKRNWSGKRYSLEYLSGYMSTSDNVENTFIKYKCKGKVYSQIDKTKFISLLEYKELCKGCFSMLVGRHKSLIKKNYNKINKLRDEISDLQKRNYELAKFEIAHHNI